LTLQPDHGVAAHKRKKEARTDTDASGQTRDIAKALPAMLEAYAAPEIVQTEPKTEMQAESDQDDDESTRKRFDYYCVPASPAMQALVDFVWPSGLRINNCSHDTPKHTTSSSVNVPLQHRQRRAGPILKWKV